MTTTASFLVPVQEEIQEVEALMRLQAERYHPDLGAAMDLLISAGGKRIRPAMAILAGKMLGAQHDQLIFTAAAIELLHTATLVHDDLIDNSLLRRGMPTLNSQWSPGATVLTGDFIFARAAKLASDTNSLPFIKLFAQTLTTIVNGELVQLLGSRCAANRENYWQRIYAKTASLFETSAASAALITNASTEITGWIQQYGHEIGMAFQIIDDILDFTGDQVTIGKPVGSDLRQGIITLPVIEFIEAEPGHPDAQLLLDGKCPDDQRLEQLIEAIRQSGAIQQSYQEAAGYVSRGLDSLRNLPPSPYRHSLEELANYIIERNF